MEKDQPQNCWLAELHQNKPKQHQEKPELHLDMPETAGIPGGYSVNALFSSYAMSLPVGCDKDANGEPLIAGTIVKIPGNFKTEQLLEVMALPGSANLRVFRLLQKFSLDPCFPSACEAEADAWLENPGLDDEALDNLTHLPFVTIDNSDSRDLDQAIHIATAGSLDTQSASIVVHYALADASYYVRPGSALFNEALERTVTYYAPDIAVPMLPRQLSEGLVSLNPGVKRRALVFRMLIKPDGSLGETQVTRAIIRSRAKLSYAGVQEFIDFARAGRQQEHTFGEEDYADSMRLLELVGERRIDEARNRNVINYNRSEATISIDNDDRFAIKQRERYDSERYNEQVSLMCNMEGARLLSNHQDKDPELHSIFRIHGAPLDKRLRHLRQDIDSLADARQLSANWRWKPGQRLDEYLGLLPRDAGSFALHQVIERMILLTNQASLFDDEPGPHHALGVEYYARFSAPMREIVGIFVHKELLETLDLETAADSHIDTALRQQIIERSNRSRKQQKKLEQEARLLAIRQHFYDDLSMDATDRPLRQGTIMGMRGGKIYLSVDGFGADVKVYTDDLGDAFGCRYKVDGVKATPQKNALNNKRDSADHNPQNDSGDPPTFVTGDRMAFKTHRYDDKRSRFVFIPDTGFVPTAQ